MSPIDQALAIVMEALDRPVLLGHTSQCHDKSPASIDMHLWEQSDSCPKVITMHSAGASTPIKWLSEALLQRFIASN